MRAVVVVIIVVVDDEGWNATFKMLTLNVNSLSTTTTLHLSPNHLLLSRKRLDPRCHSHSVSATEKT